jgi:aminoglycoside phosphotransferase family enzyme/predicted kinase
MENRQIVNELLRPEAYPWQPETVELIETHISWVFLSGNRVVKLKRPVAFPFVDHTSLSSRHQSCLDEMRLNRRLTDDVYLNVVPIVQTRDGCRVGGAGTPIEWATLMRRLPADRMLDVLLASGTVPTDLAQRLAERLVPFHRDVALRCGNAPQTAATVTEIVTDNLDELAPFAGTPLGTIQLGLVSAAMRRFVSEWEEIFRARAADGWVREGHGDLRAEHICLEPDGTVQIFDCVEFNREVRCADVASDLAFLLMDLSRLGVPQVAAALIARYREAGVDLPDELLRFYSAHRALVRTKVACLQLAGREQEAASADASAAADYLDSASAAALTIRPVLVVTTGLSGTGKSTVARRLARALGARLFSSDVVRKEIAGIAGAAPAAWEKGIYRPEWTKVTYDRLFALAESSLSNGEPVVLDATFLDADQRTGAANVAARAGTRLVLVETVCDQATVAARLVARAARGDSPSDASMSIFRQQMSAVSASPPKIPAGALATQVDTATDGSGILDPVFAALENKGIVLPIVPTAPTGSGSAQ